MKKSRRTTEQIIRILRESEGLKVEEACRAYNMSPATYHRDSTELVEVWKNKYGGMGVKEART